jgi:hypothetical protein
VIHPKKQTQAESSGESGQKIIPRLTVLPRQDKSSKILYREASIYHGRESSALSPQDERLSPATKKLELRLFHAFMSHLSPVQAYSVSGHVPNGSVTNIPILTMKYVYARNILLGCSATLLRANNPNDKSLVDASHSYAVRAISECSKQLRSGVHQDNVEGLFFASMFVAKHAFASRQYDDLVGDKTSDKQGELPLLRWLRQFRGIRAIIDAGWAWLPKCEHLSPMLSALPPPTMIPEERENKISGCLLEGLDETDASPETVTAYKVTVDYLTSVVNDPDFRGLVGFPIAVPDRFIELLEERDPRAMTIIGAYLAFLILSPRSEFLGPAARREYRVIMEELPVEWIPKLERAMCIVERNTPISI